MSTIKLKPVEAIGATEKEFEIDGDISSSIVLHSDGYIQTSTLPSIAVPKLTSNQVSQAITAMTMGYIVVISVEDVGAFAIAEVDTENMTIKMPYVNYFVTYELSGNNVIAEYINVSSKMYKHTIKYFFDSESLILEVISSSNTKLIDMKIINYFENTGWFLTFSPSNDGPVIAAIDDFNGDGIFTVRARDLHSGNTIIDDVPFSDYEEVDYSILEI